MWELLPIKIKYGLPTVLAILIYLVLTQVCNQSMVKSFSYTITMLTILSWLFGKYLWKYVYLDVFKHKFCPDFNGKWTCSIKSNFGNGTTVEFPLELEADFFSIKMKANTTVGRTYSNYCKVIRTEDDIFELEYMFKGYNDTPSNTDTSYYEGAARLRVVDIAKMDMKGVFWTNRCWQNNLNTAGEIVCSKVN